MYFICMRKYVLLLMLLLTLNISLASTVHYGEVRIRVVNKPPTITKINILPEEPYYDDVLQCHIEVDDESPETVSFDYKWYVNKKLQNRKGSTFFIFDETDNITCIATPTDQHDLQGRTKKAITKINTAPIHVKALKPTLNLAGIQVSAKEITESTSMGTITGMVTGEREGSNITLVFMLTVFTLILISINLFGLVITLKRKSKSPKQDYQIA